LTYRIRAYDPADRRSVAELLTRLWSRDVALNEQYLRWRYENNPFPPSLIAVCEHPDGIVAVRGAHGMRWRAGEETVAMPCLGDTVVDKRHERRGLVHQLTVWLFAALAERGIDFVVNQSPGAVVERISLRTGWVKVAQWETARAANTDDSGATDFTGFDASAAGGVQRDGVRISAEAVPPSELAALAAQCRPHRIGHDKDEAYFNWRFDNPFGDYRLIHARTDRLAGYLVLGRGLHRPWHIRILELSGVDGRIQALLLEQALSWGGFREVRTWWSRYPRRVVEVLRDQGFAAARDSTHRRPALLLAATRGPLEGLRIDGLDALDARSWDARMIHHDAT